MFTGVNGYSDSVEASSVQSQKQMYSETWEKQNRTDVPRQFYGQITYNTQKPAYTFIENNAVVPMKNSMDVIYYDSTKRCFKYNQKQKLCYKLVLMNINKAWGSYCV